MRARLRVLTVSVAAAVVLALSCGAGHAASALSPPLAGDTLLGFGESYGESRVHSGVDIAGNEGACVHAPSRGTVTFAGRLPSADGGTLAVTITTPDGLKVTCLPLSELRVAMGEPVDAGGAIGALAGTGDPSSAEAHAHLSVREGESYLDPEKLLSVPSGTSQPEPEPEQQAAPDAANESVPAASPGVASVAPAAVPAALAARAAVPAASSQVPGHATASADAPLRASSAVGAVSACASALRVPSAVPRPQAVAPTSGVPALDVALRLFARLRVLVTALAALLVSAACLWPVWRRVSVPAVTAEVAPVRVRS